MRRFVPVVLLVTATYLLMLDSFAVADIVVGLLLSSALYAVFRHVVFTGPPLAKPGLLERIIWIVPFALAVAKEIVVGTWTVALMVLHIRPLRRVGIVEVPIEDRTPNGVAVTSMVDTLAPGSVLVDVDWERGVMLFHILGDMTADDVRDAYHGFYQRYQRHVFP